MIPTIANKTTIAGGTSATVTCGKGKRVIITEEDLPLVMKKKPKNQDLLTPL